MNEEKNGVQNRVQNRVLLVDDDREVLLLNGEYLKRKGLEVFLAENAPSAMEQLKINTVDCIVLDVMMPGTDGFEAFEDIRKLSQAPILFLTGRTEEADRIRGLTLGADDYIIKPCSLEELALRIRINIRRSAKTPEKESVLEFPPLRIELLQHKAFHLNEEILLSNREYELLALFARNPGRELSFREIGQQLYNGYIEADRKNIMMTASRLRKKLEGYVGMENIIETVWGKGYRFRG